MKLYLSSRASSIFCYTSHINTAYVVFPFVSTVFLVVVKLFPKTMRTFIVGLSMNASIIIYIIIKRGGANGAPQPAGWPLPGDFGRWVTVLM